MKDKKLTIAIDFDGVLHRYSKGWNGGEIYDSPVPGAKEALQKLKDAGHKLYIFSTRSNKMFKKKDTPDQDVLMKAWMEKHGIVFDKIWSFGKPMADIFIDDRNIAFRGDWTKTFEEIKRFEPWFKEEA